MGCGRARVGEGEEGGLVGSAEPGDPNLAGGPVLPMKLRVCRSGICLLSLCNSSYSLCCPLWPPKVVPKRLTARSCSRGHIYMPENGRVCQRMEEYARVCQSMPEYARVCQSMQEYAKVCQSMPEYARVCKSMPLYAR